MLLALRRESAGKPRPRSLAPALKLFAWMASRPRVYRQAARVARWSLSRFGRKGWIVRLPGLAAGWTVSRDLKAPASTSFQEAWVQREKAKGKRDK
jgi:L-lactate dehydrogenase complex protein LldF